MSGETSGTPRSYTEVLQCAARSKYGARRERKALAKATGYSYEQIRKVWNGDPIVGRDLNIALCGALGLDPREMWSLAQELKAQKKYGRRIPLTDPDEERWVELWHRLPHRNRSLASAIIEALTRS